MDLPSAHPFRCLELSGKRLVSKAAHSATLSAALEPSPEARGMSPVTWTESGFGSLVLVHRAWTR